MAVVLIGFIGVLSVAANDLWGGLLQLCRYFDFIHTRL